MLAVDEEVVVFKVVEVLVAFVVVVVTAEDVARVFLEVKLVLVVMMSIVAVSGVPGLIQEGKLKGAVETTLVMERKVLV